MDPDKNVGLGFKLTLMGCSAFGIVMPNASLNTAPRFLFTTLIKWILQIRIPNGTRVTTSSETMTERNHGVVQT